MEEIEELVANGITVGVAWALLGMLLLLLPLTIPRLSVRRRRRFWCATARRKVEVEFEERGLPGRRRPVNVVSCSCFSPTTEIGCPRHCLDSTFRRLRTSPLAVGGPQ